MAKIIGIDLGTTNSVVAVMEGDQATVITNAEGNRITPSVVAFTDKKERLVGQLAKRQGVINPTKTISSIKRFMGRRHKEVGSEEKTVPFKIAGSPEDLVKVDIDGKQFTPPEISAMVLQNLKKTAEEYLGESVQDAVITVPAYFNDSQRQATKDAGKIAGLNVKRIINEPTAASLAFGLDKKGSKMIVVFDLGGGTFDVSILDVDDGVFQVLATNGDTHLGGDDFDMVLRDYIADEFKKEHGIELRNDAMALQRLNEAAEKAKCELSTSTTTEINLPFITADSTGPKHLTSSITRATFEQMVDGLVDKCRKPCETAIKDAKINIEDISDVVLVGGSSRIPKVQELVKNLFGKEPNKSINPDEVVAAGAAIQGAVLSGDVNDILLLDVTPLSLGIETMGNVSTALIQKNTTIPTNKKEVFTTAADGQTSVDIHVLQGERPMAADNRTLGRFQLTGLPSAARGVPQIEVSFDIDANGILNVHAKDLGTGKEQSISITASSGLSETEIKKMQEEAELHSEEDGKKRELVDLQNQAEQLIYTTEKTLSEHSDKIDDSEKTTITAAVEKLKSVKDSDNPEEIKSAIEELTQVSQKLTEAMYKNVSPETESGCQSESCSEDACGDECKTEVQEDVVDADFSVKS
jgi:molecular chaperone DnaK